MSALAPPTAEAVTYPDSDGEPIAENTLQFRWIVTLQGNLDALFRDDPAVFVAGDNLIYPVEGDNRTRQAPDVYVAFGRPKGDRGSYRVWEEGGVFPQVVFEVLSPGNRAGEMSRKLRFYEEYGAEEYYVLDPDRNTLLGYRRTDGRLVREADMNGFVSPRLGVRFDLSGPAVEVLGPDGERFLNFIEERQRAEQEARRAEQEGRRAEQERRRADHERERADRLAARLRELGVDPDAA